MCFLLQPPGGVPAAQPMLPNMDPRLQGKCVYTHTHIEFSNIKKTLFSVVLIIFRTDAKDECSQRNGTYGPWTPGNITFLLTLSLGLQPPSFASFFLIPDINMSLTTHAYTHILMKIKMLNLS